MSDNKSLTSWALACLGSGCYIFCSSSSWVASLSSSQKLSRAGCSQYHSAVGDVEDDSEGLFSFNIYVMQEHLPLKVECVITGQARSGMPSLPPHCPVIMCSAAEGHLNPSRYGKMLLIYFLLGAYYLCSVIHTDNQFIFRQNSSA